VYSHLDEKVAKADLNKAAVPDFENRWVDRKVALVVLDHNKRLVVGVPLEDVLVGIGGIQDEPEVPHEALGVALQPLYGEGIDVLVKLELFLGGDLVKASVSLGVPLVVKCVIDGLVVALELSGLVFWEAKLKVELVGALVLDVHIVVLDAQLEILQHNVGSVPFGSHVVQVYGVGGVGGGVHLELVEHACQFFILEKDRAVRLIQSVKVALESLNLFFCLAV